MQFTEYAEPQFFLNVCMKFLMLDEAANNLLLSSALSIARSSSGRSPGISYFTVHREGTPLAAAMNVSERRLLLSVCESSAARFAGEGCRERGVIVRSILGPQSAAGAFSLGLAGNKPETALMSKQKLLQLVLNIKDLKNSSAGHPNPTGLWRVAQKKDQRLIYTWTRQFVEECSQDESPRETEDLVDRYLANRQLFIWENDVSPVAMAGFGGLTPYGARINMVYTDPRARGRGYAGALVGAVYRRLLGQGERKFCFLFVDSLNHAALRAYKRIGFQHQGNFEELR
jgi:predicted GNAT family acetyltransferase